MIDVSPTGVIEVLPDVDTITNVDGDHERCAHIVFAPAPLNPQAVLLDALMNGTPVTALCGKTWEPRKDPERYPVCTGCITEFETSTGRPWAGRR